MKKTWSLVAVGCGVGLLLAEIGYRVHLYKTVERPTGVLTTPESLYQFDEAVGYRYRPNKNVMAYWWGEGPVLLRANQIRTNNQGHVSLTNDSVQKPAGEFRIAIVGDSLSACIHNEKPWPGILETLLNRDVQFKRQVNAKRIKVINFARDGIGVDQFPAIMDHEVRDYDPDLTLVNFITADIYRRFMWRGELKGEGFEAVLSCVSLPVSEENPECAFANNLSMTRGHFNPSEVARATRQVVERQQERKPWFTWYPQVAATLMGKPTSFVLGRNPFTPRTPTIEKRSESIDTTARAIQRIASTDPNTHFLLLPVYWEIVKQAIPKLAGEVMRASYPVQVVPMVMYLPQSPSVAEVDSWTHFPSDMHFSDKGAAVYAAAVQRYLIELTGNKKVEDDVG